MCFVCWGMICFLMIQHVSFNILSHLFCHSITHTSNPISSTTPPPHTLLILSTSSSPLSIPHNLTQTQQQIAQLLPTPHRLLPIISANSRTITKLHQRPHLIITIPDITLLAQCRRLLHLHVRHDRVGSREEQSVVLGRGEEEGVFFVGGV